MSSGVLAAVPVARSMGTAEPFFSPFHLSTSAMQRLFLVDFVKDADPIYKSLELQVFDDEIGGKGLLVIAYRQDGKVDVYYQPGVKPRGDFNSIAGGLADQIVASFEAARFDLGEFGVDIDCRLIDKTGRSINLRVRENGPKPRIPFSLLAPLGSSNTNPILFPLFLMHDFSIMRQSGNEVNVLIDGKPVEADKLPVPVFGSMVSITRYSTDPYILHWNTNYDGALSPVYPSTNGTVEHQGLSYQLEKGEQGYAIHSMAPIQARHDVQFSFSPALPDPTCLADGAQVKGKFLIDLEKSMGKIDGTYALHRAGNKVSIELKPGGWQPGERHWSLQLLFLLRSFFKNWPKTYRWDATLDLCQPEAPQMKSNWSRI